MELKGKSVIITGGAKGIGAGIAKIFAKNGCNIALNYKSTVSDELISEIERYGVECFTFKGDMSKFDEASQLVELTKEKFGSVDIVVNNAGITRDALLMRMFEEDFDSVIETNLKGTFNIMKHVSGIMLKQKSGTIINISSVVGVMGNSGQANYAASKAGIIGLTKTAAKELGSRGITCNAIAPGFIETDMTSVLKDDVIKKMCDLIALKKLGTVEDVAEVALFLAKQKYITGQVINVCGGMVI